MRNTAEKVLRSPPRLQGLHRRQDTQLNARAKNLEALNVAYHFHQQDPLNGNVCFGVEEDTVTYRCHFYPCESVFMGL